MPSERGKRKYEAAILAAELKETEVEMQRSARRAQALRSAIAVLEEEPKARISTKMRRHYLPVSKGTVYEQDCGECGATQDGHVTVDGQARDIRVCSWCGADVEQTQSEKNLDDVQSRLAKKHVKEALDATFSK